MWTYHADTARPAEKDAWHKETGAGRTKDSLPRSAFAPEQPTVPHRAGESPSPISHKNSPPPMGTRPKLAPKAAVGALTPAKPPAGTPQNRLLHSYCLWGSLHLAGLLLGALMVGGNSRVAAAFGTFGSWFLSWLDGQALQVVFSVTYLTELAWLTLLLLTGLCAFGAPLLPVFSVLLGALTGGLLAWLYAQAPLRALGAVFLCLLGPLLLFSLAHILLSRKACQFSWQLMRLAFAQGETKKSTTPQSLLSAYLRAALWAVLPCLWLAGLGRFLEKIIH